MSLRRIIDWSIAQASGDLVGLIASPFYQFYADGSNWMWACDVDIGEEQVLRMVPVASNNRELIYAEQGKAVALRKVNDGRYVISGLSKTSRGFGHIIYVTFEEDLVRKVREAWSGLLVRPLTYGELGSLCGEGYGILPYGSQGRFTASGSFVELIPLETE